MSPSEKSERKRRTRSDTRSRSEGESRSLGTLIQSALFGSLCGLLSSTLLLFAVTFLCLRAADPEQWMTPLSLGALYLSSLVAGFAALKRNRASALLCGGMAGLGLMIVFLCLSFFFHSTHEPSFSLPLSILVRALMLPAAAVGGFLGLNKPKRKRHGANRS